jgi:hypothetical protein
LLCLVQKVAAVLAAADAGSQNGALSAADWTRFLAAFALRHAHQQTNLQVIRQAGST